MKYSDRYTNWLKNQPLAKISILNVYSKIVCMPPFDSNNNPEIIKHLEFVHDDIDENGGIANVKPLLEACSALPPHNSVCLFDSLRLADEELFKIAYEELTNEEQSVLDGIFKSFLLIENILATLKPESINIVNQHFNQKDNEKTQNTPAAYETS